MKPVYIGCLLAVFIVALPVSPGLAAVEWDIQRTLQLNVRPLDVALSLNGKWIFVLTDQGTINIYSPGGVFKDKLPVGKHIDQIKAGPREDVLLLKSTQNKTVQVLSLDFIRQIHVSGAPFKGPADAPVTIAVFSEFQ